MENIDTYIKAGMVAVLTAVRKTLAEYPDGMSPEEVVDMLAEIDQQLGLKEIEIDLLKRA